MTWMKGGSVEKELGVLVGNKLSMRQQCALVAKQADGILGCSEEQCQQVKEGDPAPLMSPGVITHHLECCVQFWGPK
ncbi:hypothetical protein TURU_010989 [Turdus rufiventris]|nr:hypothetical protein TURU_010989 [Turdus rufiventris]